MQKMRDGDLLCGEEADVFEYGIFLPLQLHADHPFRDIAEAGCLYGREIGGVFGVFVIKASQADIRCRLFDIADEMTEVIKKLNTCLGSNKLTEVILLTDPVLNPNKAALGFDDENRFQDETVFHRVK